MLAKSLAALLLGLPVAIALVGLAALLAPGELSLRTLPVLLMFFPVWVGVMCAAFLFNSGRQAWGVMGLITAGGFALIYLIKAFGLVQLPG